MSLLGDSSFKKDCSTIEHFEKVLTQLLQAHANCQKQIVQLTEENKQLKRRLTSLDKKQPSSITEKNKLPALDSRLSAKLAYAEEFIGDTERKTGAYLDVREDPGTGPANKLPAEVELCRKSSDLINQINQYIKEIDLCLAYFEQ